MMARSHAVSGLGAGLATGLVSSDVALTLLCGGLGLVTSYIPDLDHPRATAVRSLGPLGWLLCRIIRATSRATGLPAHRGLSHTVAFAALVGVAAGVASAVWLSQVSPWLLGAAAAAGVAGALVGDWVTKASLPHALWPLPVALPGPPKALRVATGKRVEKLLIFPALVAGCTALVTYALTL